MNWNRIIVGDPSPLLARSRDVHRGARYVAGLLSHFQTRLTVTSASSPLCRPAPILPSILRL
jgi:hypothetical protein